MLRHWNLVVCASLVLLGGGQAESADRNSEFAAALRGRGWHDTALEFIDWVATSPLATPQYASMAPLERARSLAEQSRTVGKRAEQSRLRLEAGRQFAAFGAAEPQTPETAQSLREAIQMLAGEALAALERRDRLPEQAAQQRQDLQAEAQGHFSQALEMVERLQATCAEQLAALPKAAMIQADEGAKKRRDQLRNLQAEARFMSPWLSFEQADAFASQSAEFKGAIEQASKGFASLHEDEAYRETLVGASSRFYEGRCFQELGDFPHALECFHDLVSRPVENEEFRRWIARAQRHRLECLLALDKTLDAVRDGEDWLQSSRPSERERPEWLGVAFRLADAYLDLSKADDANASDVKKYVSAARALLKSVAQTTNEFQTDARLRLATMGNSDAGPPQFDSFAAALEAGKAAVELMNSSQLAVQLAKDNNPDALPGLASQAAEAKDQARGAFERAAQLIDAEAPAEQAATLRAFLCLLYWEDQRWHEAAITGEYLLRRYPESPHALSAARVALASYEQLYRTARQRGDADGGRYEAARLEFVARALMERWPQAAEASTAAHLMIRLALEDDRLDEAERLLAQMPPDGRAAAQLTLGSALWTQSLKLGAAHASAQSAQSEPAQSEQAVADLRGKARSLLEQGYGALQQSEGAPSMATAVGVLHLVQLQAAEERWPAALQTLEDPKIGPLALARGEGESAARPEFVLEAYKAALRVYLLGETVRTEDARKAMLAMEEAAGAEGQPQVTKAYIGLGLQLEERMMRLAETGRRNEANATSQAFDELIGHVAQRPDAKGWVLQNWIAQSNLRLGAGLQGADARKFVERAQASYQRILEQAAQDPQFAPDPAALLGVRKRMGDCLLQLGQGAQAYEHYVTILHEKPNALELQEASSEALMAWGAADKDVDRIEMAIRGAEPQKNGKKLVWGWLRIAQAAESQRGKLTSAGASDEDARVRQFVDLFFKARLGVARARFLAANVAAPNQRAEQLKAALHSVDSLARLYPEMGGPKWKAEFEKLRAEIGKVAG